MTNLHKFANRPEQLRAHIMIKNKLYAGRCRCVTFRQIAQIYADHAAMWASVPPIALRFDATGLTTDLAASP